jgi:hypothetical protein
MKKITITAKNKYETYLSVMSSLLNLSDKEIQLLVSFNSYGQNPIKDPKTKVLVANELGINIKTLHIMLRNLANKNILIKNGTGVYELSKYLDYDDKILITINGDTN